MTAICHTHTYFSMQRFPAVKLLQMGLFSLRKGQHHGAAGIIGHIQPLAQHPGQLHSPHVEPGHQAARYRVIARMENGGVGLGGAHGYIVLPFHYGHLQLVSGQLKGCSRAGNTTADHKNIIHIPNLPTRLT